LVDSTSMAIKYLRETGMLIRGPEFTADLDRGRVQHGAAPAPLYPS